MKNNQLIKTSNIAINQPSCFTGLPRKGCVFRIHPDQPIKAAVVFTNMQWYLFDLDVINHIKQTTPFIPSVYDANLYQAVDSNNNHILIVISLGSTGESYSAAIEQAKDQWVEREDSDKVIFKPRPDYHKEPQWTISFEDLLNLAFSNRYIADMSHPVLQNILNKSEQL